VELKTPARTHCDDWHLFISPLTPLAFDLFHLLPHSEFRIQSQYRSDDKHFDVFFTMAYSIQELLAMRKRVHLIIVTALNINPIVCFNPNYGTIDSASQVHLTSFYRSERNVTTIVINFLLNFSFRFFTQKQPSLK
jgi:hypothetical protein